MDVTPSCTRQSYSLLGVTIRALAENSQFTDVKLNRNCCNRWDSYCSLTHTKQVILWSFPKPRRICSVPGTATFTCRHLELQCPTHSPAGQNFLPTSAGFLPAKLETGPWNVSAIGKAGPLLSHTHRSAERQGTGLETRENTLAQLFLQEPPKGIWRWGRGIDLAKGGENLQLMWSEWDRLSAGMTADDGVIKYLL